MRLPNADAEVDFTRDPHSPTNNLNNNRNGAAFAFLAENNRRTRS